MRALDGTSPPQSLVLTEGTLLAQKYRLARRAGFGGMAQLWVATNEATCAEVCIKIFVPDESDDDAVERFRREAYAAARLSHRAIVRIFDLVELGPSGDVIKGAKPAALAIVMELLHGETLGDFLMKKGKLPLDEAIDLTLPFLSALAHAHRAGVVHRDLKPDNIFLSTDPDGHVIPKVLDFGVSKLFGGKELGARSADARPLTFDGVMLGTPSYMSPEQARGGRNIDARSDVFSAGILFYMMLAGRNPFESESFHSVIAAVLEREAPRPPGVPDPLWEVIEKAMAKDAALRYADATELGIALRRATGRTSTTDSGPHSLPSSARMRILPLGGDSHVTVPPAGTENEAPDAPNDAVLPGATTAARRRSVRIVLAVIGAAIALTVAALLRGPTRADGEARDVPSRAADTGRNAGPNSSTPASEPVVSAAVTTTVAAPKVPAGADAGHATIVTPTPPGPRTPPTPNIQKAPTLLPPPKKDPSLVRDPGF